MASVSTKVEVSGSQQFKNDFKEAANAVKATSAELKFFSNELTRNGASVDALKNKLSALTKAYDAEDVAIAKIQSRLDELSEAGQENSTEFTKLTQDLYKHKDAQAQIQTEIQGTERELERLESGADEAGDEISNLGDVSQSAGDKLGSSFANDIAKATTFMNKMVDVAIDIAKALFNIGKDAVEYNAQMESYSRTIEAFFKTSGQTAEEAAQNTADLIANQKELAIATGIGADKLIDANKMLIASGVNGEKSQKAISALSKAIVATGGGNEELSRMASNLQQISNTGKASTQDMKQFAMAGVDVYGLMAESTGKTVEQLKEMDITFDMIVDALDNATQEGGKFYEASQVGASTLNGQISTLQSTIQDKLGIAFEPFNEALKNDILPQVQELAEDIDWEKLGQMMADAAEVATDAFGILVKTLDELAEAYGIVKDAVDDWGNVEDRVTNDVSNGYIGTAGAFKKAYDEHERFASGTQTGMNTIKDKVTDVNKTIAGMPTAWSSAVPLAQGVGNDMANAVSTPIMGLQNEAPVWMEHFGTALSNSLSAQAPKFGAAASELARAAQVYLEFTVPEKGPLHNYREWMPHFVEGLAETMKESQWRLEQASASLAQSVVNNSSVYNNTFNVYGGTQDPNLIADRVMLRIQQATNQRRAVWA